MKKLTMSLLISVLGLAAWIPASAALSNAAMTCANASPQASPRQHQDYLFYHGLVSPHGPMPSKPASVPPCSPAKVIRT
jgi:hypothetical protein